MLQMSRLKRSLSNGSIRQFCEDCSQVPAIIVTGDKDRVVPTASAHALAAELQQCDVAVLPECGHLSHEESPQLLLTVLQAFVHNTLPL